MIVIIDYDMGNIGSIKNVLHKIGEKDVIVSRDRTEIKRADKLILPGVGAFDAGIRNLKKYDLFSLIHECVRERQVPILGICLGMQMLGLNSEEGDCEGLKLVDFSCKRFSVDKEYKVPHMGWDYVHIKKEDCPIVHNLSDAQRYYFVHSYYAECSNEDDILMTCDYGIVFTAAVARGNVYGTQFHPEKSHIYGMNLLANFAKEC
ncbi:MAG: imidazole glycerol phosphate synthase subunit HisH [Candidatus Gastranaerophilales bacterium]|nr:imidazole glycerol phosphate synthase subunit HisH [Candidatus Gastranaerophilales bacterium]